MQDVKTLEELKLKLREFPTPLSKTAKNFVFSAGNPDSKIMLIGEAPGEQEDLKGLPFVGAAGKLLDKMIESIGLDRTNCYICNILPWRPQNNRTPTPEEMSAFLPFVKKHIEIIQPKAILLLGGTAAKTILETQTGIMRLRGNWVMYDGKIPMLPTFHPSFLLRSPQYKKESWADLQSFRHKIE